MLQTTGGEPGGQSGTLKRKDGLSRSYAASIAFTLALALELVPGSSRDASAVGFVRLDSSSFLLKAQDRGNSTSALVVGPRLESDGKVLSTKLEAQGITFLSDRSSFTVEASNAYIATSWNLMPHHQFTLGRRVYDWSVADDAWKMGLWSPRFLWDPLRPETVGLVGAFYQYQSRSWRLLAAASPMSIPERGFPVRQENGRLTSASADWVEPYRYINAMNQLMPIQYKIKYPAIRELVMNPGATASIRYGAERGVWAQSVYGLLPIHQPDLTVNAVILPQDSALAATIYPRVLFHHLLTGEAGYRGDGWSLWASYSRESPLHKDAPSDRMVQPVGPATIIAGGGDFTVSRFSARAQILWIDEKRPPLKEGDMDLGLPSRFPYRRAVKVGGRWDVSHKFVYDMSHTRDVAESSGLTSIDMTYLPGKRWSLGVGADFFASDTGRGLIGQYEGNDRVRGRISYEF
jgi:hypothetical protein